MKINEINVGDILQDTWWREKIGKVVKVLKTRIKINFNGKIETYDKSHLQFLKKYEVI